MKEMEKEFRNKAKEMSLEFKEHLKKQELEFKDVLKQKDVEFSNLMLKREKEFELLMEQNFEEMKKHVKEKELEFSNMLQELKIEESIMETKFVEKQQQHTLEKICLNVGGKKFTTSMSTLTHTKSMLSAMFSGRFILEKDDENCFFIDRNGEFFEPILEYLRSGKLPKIGEEDLDDFLREVDYYGLDKLLEDMKDSVAATFNLHQYVRW